jgi:transposase-like protein
VAKGETYISVSGQWSVVSGQWKYYYRAVDKYGNVIDFLLCNRRDEKAARAFFTKAISHNGFPEKVVIDKSGSNALALHNINVKLWLMGKILNLVEVFQVKYLNNIVEQSHRKVKGKMHQCLGWKPDEGASSTLAGVELWPIIKMDSSIIPKAYLLGSHFTH